MSILDSCNSAITCAVDAVTWVNSSEDALGVQSPILRRAALRSRDVIGILSEAAQVSNGVGVFGGSQVGKSYLIEALARGDQPTLPVVLGDQILDFLTDINPGGGRESTGIVTRFSLDRPENSVPGFPVHIRLLSQLDIIKIFANSYFSDFDQNEEEDAAPSVEFITTLLKGAKAKVKSTFIDDMDDRDIDWLRVYLWERFRARQTIKRLEQANYWEEMESIAPYLPIEDRIELFAVLWGGQSRFSEVFNDLCVVLKALKFSSEAFCEISALIPRESSIIDAFKLRDLGKADSKTVKVRSLSGAETEVSLPLLTALAAELNLQMKSKAHDFQDHTNVLDFPGARSRHNWTDISAKLADPEKLAEIILRGKVAYLFERFTDEFSLNSLVLCVKPGNQEVRTISDYVTPWIEAVHGRNPEDRRGQDIALFMVLTFFDERFDETVGGGKSWHDALYTSIVELFGNTAEWVDNWTPAQTFTNVFWSRNPGYLARGLMAYDDQNREIGVLDQKRVETYRADYLQTELVKRHIADPGDAFDAAFELNDGGVGYLAKKLSVVCSPDLKDAQIAVRLKAVLQDLKSGLGPHYVPLEGSEDAWLQRKKRLQTAVKGLIGLLKNQRFGHFLSELTVAHEDVVAALSRMPEETEGPDPKDSTRYSDSDILGVLGDILDEPMPASTRSKKRRGVESEGVRLARIAVDAWTEKIATFAADSHRLQNFGLDREIAADLTQEIVSGSHIDELINRISVNLDSIILPAEKLRTKADKTATVCVEYLNSFSMNLGQHWLGEADRARNGFRAPVFSQSKELINLNVEKHDETPRQVTFFGDWCAALLALAENNALSGGDENANTPTNKELGRLLEQIDKELSVL